MGSVLGRVSGNMEVSIERTERAREMIINEMPEIANMCNFEQGWSLFVLNRFEESQKYLIDFGQNHKAKSLKGWSAYLLGLTYFFLGD